MQITSGASAWSWRTASSMRRSSGGSVPQKLSVMTRRLVPTIAAARRGSFGDDDLDEARQRGRQPLPPPDGKELARRVDEALDLVEHLMIELANKRRGVLVDLGEVHDPAPLGIDLALDGDLDQIAVAMHARALVARRYF